MLWTIWIERNNKVFNHEQWRESKVKHRIRDELIIYAKTAWEQVIKHIKINSIIVAAMLPRFRPNVGCQECPLQEEQFTYCLELEATIYLGSLAPYWTLLVAQGLSLACGVGVILGLVGQVDYPWRIVVTCYETLFHV